MFDFKFDWDESLNVGIPFIDEQHQELFSIGRKLEQEILTQCMNADEKYLLKLLCEIREYVTYHFYEEEKLIKELNPHLFEKHKNEHDQFIAWVNSIDCGELLQNPQKKLKEIKEALQKWVFEHILIEDRQVLLVGIESMI